MNAKDLENIFKVYPEAEELYLVDGTPFMQKPHAENFAQRSGGKVEVKKRPVKKPKATGTKKATGAKGKAAAKPKDPTAGEAETFGKGEKE